MQNKIKEILLDAGNIISSRFLTEKTIDTKSTDVDLVTEVDKQVELFLMDKLSPLFPGAEYISEETSTDIKSADYVWVMDPIDGTVNFVHGFPMVCISLALMVKGKYELAFVYNPIIDQMFEAKRGQGAFQNGRRLKISQADTFKQCIFTTGFPYDYSSNPENNLRFFDHFNRRTQGVRRPGSAAMDMAYTAAAVMDGFWEWHLKPWDVAAGTLLVEESGGIVTNFDGNKYQFGDMNIVAANEKIHKLMMKEIDYLMTKTS